MSNVSVRAARIDDAEAIAEIYNIEVERSTATFDLVPRSVESQRQWIVERSGAFSVIVANDTKHGVVGFAALSSYRDRPAYRTTVEDSVYVHRSFHRLGIGRLLLSALITAARDSGFHTVIARIDAQSTASIELHRSLGFVDVGIEREIGRKFGRWLDSAILQMILD